MTIAPVEKATLLIDTINSMVEHGVDLAELDEVRAEAEKLEEIGMFIDAKRVKGMIAALEWNIDNVHTQFLAAVRASGKEYFTCVNYAMALSNVGDLEGAIEWIDEAISIEPDNPAVIQEGIKIHIEAFDVDGADKLLLQLKALGFVLELERQVSERRAILDTFGATWKDLAERVKLASSLISRQGNVFPRGRSTFLHDGVVLIEFALHASVEDALAAESRMLETLANSPFSNLDRFLYLSCEPI